jgi:uncharacterized LabA/DUF88 family protein
MTPPNVRVAAYVDGFNLYRGMHDARGRRGLWLDLESLLGSLMGPNQQLVAVHYFTALVIGAGRERQQTYLDALEASGRCTHPHVGRFQRKEHTCRACGQSWNSYEEKESDVSLGVQLVQDAAQGVYDQALIVSGDSDMVPAVRSVRRLAPATRLVAVFPPRRSSWALESEVDGTLRIFDKVPERHQLPDPLVTAGGITLARPAHWH